MKTLPLVGLCLAILTVGCSGEKKADPNPAPGTDNTARHGLTAAQAAAVLVQVGDTKITVGEFADQIAEQSPYLRARYNSPERRKEFLDSVVRFELLAQEAKRRGFFGLDEVKRAEKQTMIQQMMRHDFEDKFKLADITDAEIKAYYDAHIVEFKKPEQVRIEQILVKNVSLAQRVLGQIKQAPTDQPLFKRIAAQYNEDAGSKDSFGDVGFQSLPKDRLPGETSTVPDAVVSAAFALKNLGDVHPELVKTDLGYHVVKLVARRPPLVRSVEDAKRMIQDRLRRDKRDQALDTLVSDLRKKASVKEEWSLLDSVKVEVPQGVTPENALIKAKEAAAEAEEIDEAKAAKRVGPQ